MAVFLPCALFCFLIFGVEPMISQLVNQLECDRLGATDCDASSVNGAAVLTMKYIEIVQYSCATLTLGTIGSLSDYTGRRLTMALSLVGQLVQTVVVLVVAMAGPGMAYRTALYLIYAGTVATGLSGSYGTFLMGVYAYGADVTKESPSERGRTFARYTGAVAIGNTLGPLVNGLLLDHYGFTAPLAVLTVAGLAILVLLACIPESLSPADHPAAPLDVLRKHNTLAVFCRFLLDADRRDSSRGGGPGAKPVRRRPAGKPSLLPLAAVFCLCFSDLVGQGTIFLYYARRVFHWRPAWLGYYESSVGFSKGVVLLLLLPLAYRCLGRPPNDYVVCLIGMLFNMGYFLMLALLPFPEAAVAAVPLTGLGQMTYPHLRSLFSLAVSRDSQGQLFSLISALETLATTLTPVVVNTVYNHTVDTFPGMVWLVLAGYLVLAMLALNLAWRSAHVADGDGSSSSRGSSLAIGSEPRSSKASSIDSLLLLDGGDDDDGRHESNETRRQLLGFEDHAEEEEDEGQHGGAGTGVDRL